jgi:hypothetical protein
MRKELLLIVLGILCFFFRAFCISLQLQSSTICKDLKSVPLLATLIYPEWFLKEFNAHVQIGMD